MYIYIHIYIYICSEEGACPRNVIKIFYLVLFYHLER